MSGRRLASAIPKSRGLSSSARHQSTALHFYQNRQLDSYASKEAKRLTLRQLVFYGRFMTEERLINSANYVRTELPVRIAHRLRDLQALPYVVVTQEGVAKVYELYWSAFESFRRYPPIASLDQNTEFCKFIKALLNEHAPVIPNLSLGLSLSSPYLPPDQLDSFMRRMLVSRISRRVLAEHHIALSKSYSKPKDDSKREPHVGIISTELDIRETVSRCARLLQERSLWAGESPLDEGARPEVQIEGHTGTRFAYIREHFEYIIFELLKNSMRATTLKHPHESTLPPITVTIVAGENEVGIRISDQGGGLRNEQTRISTPSDLFSFSHIRNAARMDNSRLGALRSASVSKQGLRATVDEQVKQRRQYDDGDEVKNAAEVFHPRIGIGLPMSNIYATYFGGSLELVSLDGWGTDVYLRLPKLGTNLEGIEL